MQDKTPKKNKPGTEKKSKDKEGLKELMEGLPLESILGGCKDLFKKDKQDPNFCEITIKAPSEAVLKLFKAS